jgi:hypothetical protein
MQPQQSTPVIVSWATIGIRPRRSRGALVLLKREFPIESRTPRPNDLKRPGYAGHYSDECSDISINPTSTG